MNKVFQVHYGYDGRTVQKESAVHLLHGRTVFLLAGTGFGKSRVPEAFYLAHDRTNYALIVLCINPLDSLGDDQVSQEVIYQRIGFFRSDTCFECAVTGQRESQCALEQCEPERAELHAGKL